MAVGFIPDDTVHVGDFEIVRTVARDPDDKPRIAIQTDAPLAIADVEEDEVVEEDIAEIETEDGAEGVSEASSETADRSESRSSEARSSEARSSEEGGRRRRRRGGRNRSRNRGDRDQAPEARPAEQQASGDHDAEPVSYVAPVEDAVESNGEFAGSEQPRVEGETDEGPRRRRRRRRGRRGHRDSDGTEQGEHAEAAPESESTTEAAAGDASNQESDGPVPNASSTPVWSLTPEPAPVSEPASTPVAEPVAAKPEPVAAEPAAETPAKVEAPVAVASVSEAPSRTEEPKMPVAAQQSETTATDAPSAPPRKGWWQRTFSAGD
jgi:ribonuclease E